MKSKRRQPSKKKPSGRLPGGYRNDFERKVAMCLPADAEYESVIISYPVKIDKIRSYLPDWTLIREGYIIYIEAKGYFRSTEERAKYLFIREALFSNERLVFLFQDPKSPVAGSKKRKDGTRFCSSEWAERENFRWYSMENGHRIGEDRVWLNK